MRLPGGRKVVLIKRAGSADESRQDVIGSIQPRKGFFAVDTPIDVGDHIEVPDPRRAGAPMHYRVALVEIFDGFGSMDHIEATWGPAAQPARERPAAMAIGDLHATIGEVAGALFTDGHFGQAAFEAFKAVETRVRAMTGIDEIGQKLMGRAFGGSEPTFRLTAREGKLGQDEHNGRTQILLGAMLGVRNLGAHALDPLQREVALEHLAVASLLMRWLDDAVPRT